MKRACTWLAACGVMLMLPLAVLAEEGKRSLPQLDVHLYPGLLFWLAISFPLLLVLMAVWGVPRIQQTQATRRGILRADLVSAEADNEQAQMMQAAYEKALADARAEARKTVSAIAAAAAQEESERRAVQQKELERRLAEAETRLDAVRKAALKDVPAAADDLAAAIAAKLVGHKA